MSIFPIKELPDYYCTMYQDGYTPHQVFMAYHKYLLEMVEEREKEKKRIDEIKITSEVIVK